LIDIIYLAHNRLEFTRTTLPNLIANTNWNSVDRFIVYDDASSDGTTEYLLNYEAPRFQVKTGEWGSPVAVMNDYLVNEGPNHSTFAKIDNDTMVPSGWLESCLYVMDADPGLDLLGIEAFRPVQPGIIARSYDPAQFIGGIGLMRVSAFREAEYLPRPNGRQGFTQWQERHGRVRKGWLNPALPVFLLDWLPREPWLSLTAEYVEQGWSRDWHNIFPEVCPYPEDRNDLWSWWCE
jgi:hypothetical protein